VLTRLRDAWSGSEARAVAVITKGFIVAKDYSLIGAKILRDHGANHGLPTRQGAGGAGEEDG
jgi:hypothetical protein